MKTTRLFHLGVSGLALICAACGASSPSKELMTARSAYAEARNGEAARLNPTGVHDAYKALQAAEAAFEDDAGSSKERNYAYIATRKSELAVAEASEALARQEQQRAQETYQAALEQQSQQGSQAAEQLTQTQQELQAVQAAAAAAEQQLREMQALREEGGKLVISLSGVLFETGKADLNSMARERLDTVATALTAYPDRVVAIEGHTDAQGDEEKNRALSQLRANAVREYLESKGVPAGQLRAEGRGEESPIASNDTPEGRANNRRVEIVLSPPTGPGQEPSRQPVGGTDSDTADDPKQGMPHQQHQKQPQKPPQQQAPQPPPQ